MVGRVLVVDDYQPWVRLIRSMLPEAWELQVIAEASDGREAVQKAIELQPDLILLDIGLPALNGIEISIGFERSILIFFSFNSISAIIRLYPGLIQQ